MTLQHEVAIPFDAFVVDRVEPIDEISDEIDGNIVAAEPGGSAAASVEAPLYARPGRVVVALAGPDLGSAEAMDVALQGFLDRLADLAEVPPDVYPRRGHQHHDPADLTYWGKVDASRGRLATALDVIVCSHYLGVPRSTYVLTVEAPAHRLGLLVSTAEAIPGATRRALLTAAGPVSTEPDASVVLLAAAEHAHRLGGRAEVFPGQEWLTGDLPVANVIGRTIIDEVRSTQGPYAPAAVLRAYGFVRPRYEEGRLVVTVGHDDPLVVTPWEVRYCRPCCG